MKKVLSILVAVALVLSCCVVAFASDTTLTKEKYVEGILSVVDSSDFYRVMSANNVVVSAIPNDYQLNTDQIYEYLEMLLEDEEGCLSVDNAKSIVDGLKYNNPEALTDEQVEEVKTKIDEWKEANENPGDSGDSGSGDSGSGLPFDIDLSNLGNITDIFSNLGGNIDLSKFLEGAKSGIGQLFDGLKGAGLPDISGLTGLLGSIPGLDMIMGLFGGGGDDGGNGGGSGTTPSPYTPSTNPSGGNSNSQVIPKTADTAPIAAVATLAVVAGVAFVLTRKKNED